MYYGAIKKLDIANGPGVRVSIFVSGCRNHCHGCFNPETWNFAYGEEFTDETLRELMEALDHPNVSGISILGGDAFEPENISCVLDICKKVKACKPDKSIWVWTGYNFEDLKELPIMHYIDVLVDGRFEESKKDLRLKWRGSSNQRVISVQESLETGEIILCYE
jgi:anaerobic ribonucleoside-triphosphate reductase activating protein